MKTSRVLPLVFLALIPGCNPAHPVAIDSRAPSGQAAVSTSDGIRALARLQNSTGGFSGPSGTDHVGITALAGLAMLSAWETPGSVTQVPAHLDATAKFILNSQKSDGYFYNEGDSTGMYGHAFATLYLTQLYATVADPADKEKVSAAIKKAIHLIESAQGKQGGWRYTPTLDDADVSVTAAQLKALVAAKEQGFAVADATLSRAISYLKSAQQPDGGFAYTLQSPSSGWPRSAAATAALLYAGESAGQSTDKALAYLEDPKTKHGDINMYYGNYYFAQALNLGDPAKMKSMDAIRAALLAKQDPSTGLWPGEAGDAYATSMALIVLYMPKTQLPAFKAR